MSGQPSPDPREGDPRREATPVAAAQPAELDRSAADPGRVGTVDLVGGIVDDVVDLVGAHIEALRDELSSRLSTLTAGLTSLAIAIGVFVVTALLLGLALAASIVALGAPWWAALWLVTAAAAATGIGFLLRARSRARALDPSSLLRAAADRAEPASPSSPQEPP